MTSSSLTGQRLEQRTDCRPELLLDLNGDGVLKPVRCLATCPLRSEDADREFPVRVSKAFGGRTFGFLPIVNATPNALSNVSLSLMAR